MPPPDAGGSGGASFFSTGDRSTTFRFNPRNAEDIYAEFFGSASPFGGMGGAPRFPTSIFGDDIFTSFREGGGGSMNHQAASRKAPPIENKLPCSLEDLYKGTTKKMKISREVSDTSG